MVIIEEKAIKSSIFHTAISYVAPSSSSDAFEYHQTVYNTEIRVQMKQYYNFSSSNISFRPSIRLYKTQPLTKSTIRASKLQQGCRKQNSDGWYTNETKISTRKNAQHSEKE